MKVGFLGAGKMAEAIVDALYVGGKVAWDSMICDKSKERRDLMAKEYQVAVTECPVEVVKACKVLVLAVKPQDLDALLADIKKHLTAKHLLISIAAGKTLAALKKAAGTKPRIVRVMPNLAMTVLEGMSVYCAAANATPADKRLVARIFKYASEVLELPEKHFDAVTALSGSGPAFFAYILNAMAEAAIALKLPSDAAHLLAQQTLIGTGIYLQNTGRDVGEFIKAVASPKGTTAAGLAVLEQSDIKAILAKTLTAAATRSAELCKE